MKCVETQHRYADTVALFQTALVKDNHRKLVYKEIQEFRTHITAQLAYFCSLLAENCADHKILIEVEFAGKQRCLFKVWQTISITVSFIDDNFRNIRCHILYLYERLVLNKKNDLQNLWYEINKNLQNILKNRYKLENPWRELLNLTGLLHQFSYSRITNSMTFVTFLPSLTPAENPS